MSIDPFRPARIAFGFYQALHDYSAAETPEACVAAWRRLDYSGVDGGASRELLALRTPFVAAAVDAGVPYPEADAAYRELIAAARLLQQTAGEIPVVHTPHGKAALRAVVEKDAPGWPLHRVQLNLHIGPLAKADAAYHAAANRVNGIAGLIAYRAGTAGPAQSGRGGRKRKPLGPAEVLAVEVAKKSPGMPIKEVIRQVREVHSSADGKKLMNALDAYRRRVARARKKPS